ncbi:hypothetical protein GCM10025794_32200 [Massilia kyonggiensis]
MSMTTLDWMAVSRCWWSSTYWDENKERALGVGSNLPDVWDRAR